MPSGNYYYYLYLIGSGDWVFATSSSSLTYTTRNKSLGRLIGAEVTRSPTLPAPPLNATMQWQREEEISYLCLLHHHPLPSKSWFFFFSFLFFFLPSFLPSASYMINKASIASLSWQLMCNLGLTGLYFCGYTHLIWMTGIGVVFVVVVHTSTNIIYNGCQTHSAAAYRVVIHSCMEWNGEDEMMLDQLMTRLHIKHILLAW